MNGTPPPAAPPAPPSAPPVADSAPVAPTPPPVAASVPPPAPKKNPAIRQQPSKAVKTVAEPVQEEELVINDDGLPAGREISPTEFAAYIKRQRNA